MLAPGQLAGLSREDSWDPEEERRNPSQRSARLSA